MNLNILLVLALLFFMGSLFGWVLELFYRRFISPANPDRRWINPGFLTGPYLPLYGFSLCALYGLAHIRITWISQPVIRQMMLFLVMSVVVTVIEFVAGMIFIRQMKIKLWDYEKEWGNIKGVICPRYSFYWAVLSAIYYFLIHPRILDSIYWLANHLSFSFFMGFFYGVFAVDFWYSMRIMARIKKFAKDNDIVVRYEILKSTIKSKSEEMKEKSSFIFSFRALSKEWSFPEYLKYYLEKEQNRFDRIIENYEDIMESLKKNYENAKDSLIDSYENTRDSLMDSYENVRDNLMDRYENVKDSVMDGYENAKESIREGYENVRENICPMDLENGKKTIQIKNRVKKAEKTKGRKKRHHSRK